MLTTIMAETSAIPGYRTKHKVKALAATVVYGVMVVAVLTYFHNAPPKIEVNSSYQTSGDDLIISGKASENIPIILIENGKVLGTAHSRESGTFILQTDAEIKGSRQFIIRACHDSFKLNCTTKQLDLQVN